MTNEEIFAAWSTDDSPWSTWAKPVLFAHLGSSVVPPPGGATARDASWSPAPEANVALVLDLPGEEGVWLGATLAARGYQPVPLYNAVPLPFGPPMIDLLSHRSVAAVNVLPIISALGQNAEALARLSISPNAPPAFLLDANRQGNGLPMLPDAFDNRSICFTTDFPSANFLVTRGIKQVLLIQRDRIVPQSDLAHVLRRWQDGGLILERMRIDLPWQRERFQVSRPSWYRVMFQRTLAAFGLRRASGGGFGAWMPGSPSGG